MNRFTGGGERGYSDISHNRMAMLGLRVSRSTLNCLISDLFPVLSKGVLEFFYVMLVLAEDVTKNPVDISIPGDFTL